MAQSKLTYSDKTNPVDVIDRTQQATAEDFNEIKEAVNANADDVDVRIETVEIDVQANADAIVNKITISDVNTIRGLLVYSARILWDGTTVTKTEFVNKNKTGSSFITSVSEVTSGRLGFYLATSNANWQTDLEMFATPNVQTTASVNRNPHIYYLLPTYIGLYLTDSGGGVQNDSAFWIRIYDWS